MTTPPALSRSVLSSWIDRWLDGELTEAQLHELAESVWERCEWPESAEDDDDSIAIEVLSQLDIMDHQLITKDDGPALLAFLNTPVGEARLGWEVWRRYLDGIDIQARASALAGHEFYSHRKLR
jgi:hypothetical protein